MLGEYVNEAGNNFARIHDADLANARLGQRIVHNGRGILFAAGRVTRKRILIEVPLGMYNTHEMIRRRVHDAYIGGSVLKDCFRSFAQNYVPNYMGAIMLQGGLGAIVMQDMTFSARLPLVTGKLDLEREMPQGELMRDFGARELFGRGVADGHVAYVSEGRAYMVDPATFNPGPESLLARGDEVLAAENVYGVIHARLFKTYGVQAADAEPPIFKDVIDVYANNRPMPDIL